MRIQLSLSLHFYLFYLLLNSCDGKDAKQCVFFDAVGDSEKSRLCSALALKSGGFSLADVPSDVLLLSRTQGLFPLINSFNVL